MKNIVLYKSFSAPPVCKAEILRYMGAKELDEVAFDLLDSTITEAEPSLKYRVCYSELPLKITDGVCEIGGFLFESKSLSDRLKGSNSVVLFAATLGAEFDRLLMKYSKLSPAKALMLQAFGTERIEALCNAFCKYYEEEQRVHLTRRFSTGYGDLSLLCQREIFDVLDCEKKIGLTLNDSLLMSPSKSVTAICGISREPCRHSASKCNLCKKSDCIYRGKV